MSRRWRWPFSREAQEAQDLRESAEEGLSEARRQKVEVERVSRSLRDLRERNHFADHIERLITGKAAG